MDENKIEMAFRQNNLLFLLLAGKIGENLYINSSRRYRVFRPFLSIAFTKLIISKLANIEKTYPLAVLKSKNVTVQLSFSPIHLFVVILHSEQKA